MRTHESWITNDRYKMCYHVLPVNLNLPFLCVLSICNRLLTLSGGGGGNLAVGSGVIWFWADNCCCSRKNEIQVLCKTS